MSDDLFRVPRQEVCEEAIKRIRFRRFVCHGIFPFMSDQRAPGEQRRDALSLGLLIKALAP